MDLASRNIHIFLEKYGIKNELGLKLDFHEHSFLWDIYEDFNSKQVIYKAAQIGFCLATDTKVLTSDYRWIDIDSLRVGDKLISVDEFHQGRGQGRKKRVGTVERINFNYLKASKIIFDDGREVIATPEHRFLCKVRGAVHTEWREVSKFRVGDKVRHFCNMWDGGNYEDGWIGGIIDGEGSLRHKSGTELTIVQAEGSVFNRVIKYFKDNNYTHRITERKDNRGGLGNKKVFDLTTSNTAEIYKIIGQTRPSRFVGKTDWWVGSCIGRDKNNNSWVKIKSIEPLGKRRMVDIQTSTSTFIANGFVSHNSTAAIIKTLWLAKYKGLDIIYTLPTSQDVIDFVGGKVNRIIGQNPILQEFVKDRDTVEQKRVGDSLIYYRGTWTSRQALMVSSSLNVHDEVDRSSQKILDQYSSRLQHSKLQWQWYFSNPSVGGNGVSKFWGSSDQKHWFVKCSRCNHWQYLSWDLEDPSNMSIDLNTREYICKKCKKTLVQKDRKDGVWIKKYKNKEYSGYWINLMMASWVSAEKIIKDYETKSEEFFYNFVLGLPYVGSGNKITADVIYRNLTNTINEQEDIVIGVDVGNIKHYVVGNRDGLFYYNKTKDWDDIRGLLRKYSKSIAVIDAMPDITEPRKLRDEFPGRVFLCHYVKDRKTMQIIRWGKDKEFGNVLADRNRLIQMIIDEFADNRIPLQGTQGDWYDYYKHWDTLYRITEEDKNGVPQHQWLTSTGEDHYAHATAFWRIGMDRRGIGESKIYSGKPITDIPVAPEIAPDGTVPAKRKTIIIN